MFDACICVEPDEPVTLLDRRQPIARKEHRCFECGAAIRPGERYQLDVAVFEGDFRQYTICLTCLRIRNSLFVCGWYYGRMWADIHEGYCDEEFCICPDR